MSAKKSLQSLVSLGFNDLEARIYNFLLKESPVTGYRVAQAVGKPAANTYKAIQTLYGKGAVIIDDGSSRLCRPVPPDELVRQIERSFQKRSQQALRVLMETTEFSADADTRLYNLRSNEQVIERCRSMLKRCQSVALLDIFPEPLEEIRPDIEEAAARGVKVAIKTYQPTKVVVAWVVIPPDGQSVLSRWSGHWVNLVADGRELLLAFLCPDDEKAYQAIWSESIYLSWLYYNGLYSELSLAALEQKIEEGASAADLKKVMDGYRRFAPPEAPVYQNLRRRLGKSNKKAGNKNSEEQ